MFRPVLVTLLTPLVLIALCFCKKTTPPPPPVSAAPVVPVVLPPAPVPAPPLPDPPPAEVSVKPESPSPPTTIAEMVKKPEIPGQPPSPAPMKLVLPTDNDALFRNDGPAFYMWVDRNFEKEATKPWEGGGYGYVRGPVRVGSLMALMHFHEGIDIAPVKRDESGEPLDEVRSMSNGEVAHVSDSPGASNYGRYIVIKHDWGHGPFYSLYAHLSKALVKDGDKVEPGTPIGIMGHTGAGIDKPRSHVHVEMNIMTTERFEEISSGAENKHGIFNGLNLTGMDIASLLLYHHANPDKSILDFIKTIPAEFKVTTPRKTELPDIARLYPWLIEGADQKSPSWEITMSNDGMPLVFKPSAVEVKGPTLSWIKESGLPHSYHTRGYVTGAGDKGVLTYSGVKLVQLFTGDVTSVPKPAVIPGLVLTKKPAPKKALVKKAPAKKKVK
jgi:murein DD-endopeptidase MepM/ murein hydrolase activator NlpD